MSEKELDKQIKNNEKLYFKMVRIQFVPKYVIMMNLNGNILVTASRMVCQMFDIITGKLIALLEKDNQQILDMVSNHKFGDLVAIQLEECVRLIHIPSRKSQPMIALSAYVTQISFDSHSQFLATCSRDQTIILWEVPAGKQIKIFKGHKKEITDLHFNSNGDKLITCSLDKTARIWNVKSGNCIHVLDGHKDFVLCSEFDFSGDYCATGSSDCTCKIWDVQTGKCIQTLTGHTHDIRKLFFNINGTRIVTFSDYSTTRVYNVKTGDCISEILNCENLDFFYLQSKIMILVVNIGPDLQIYSEEGQLLQSLQNCHGFNHFYFPNIIGVIVAFCDGWNAFKFNNLKKRLKGINNPSYTFYCKR